MKTVVLDTSGEDDARTSAAADALCAGLEARGANVHRVIVRDLDVRQCTGCFGCWTRTPGRCVIADDARRIAELVIAADVYAIVTRVAFGSFGSAAKSVLDRLICLVLPHFTMIDGEVHHRARYPKYPVLLALGTLPAADDEQAALFARLVERNAVNLHSPRHAAETIAECEPPDAAISRLLEAAGCAREVTA